MTDQTAIQDLIPDNHCFGCGPLNPDGLQIKSYWSGLQETVCTYQPLPHHMAGPTQILNGGIIATLIDCHCICTAVADAYRREGREVGEPPMIWYATGLLTVRYLKPSSINKPVVLKARIEEAGEKKTRVICEVFSDDIKTVEGDVLAVRVPLAWRDHGHQQAG